MFDKKEYDKSRYQRIKSVRLQEVKDYQKSNLQKVLISHRKWYFERRMKVFTLLGNKCSICGFSDWRTLQVDHINGGGNKQRKQLSSICLLSYVLKHPKEFQLLCANCNWIKRYENKEHGEKERGLI